VQPTESSSSLKIICYLSDIKKWTKVKTPVLKILGNSFFLTEKHYYIQVFFIYVVYGRVRIGSIFGIFWRFPHELFTLYSTTQGNS